MSITIEGGSMLSSLRETALAQRVQQAKTIPADVYAEEHSLRPIVDEEVSHDRYDTAFSQEDVEEDSVQAANQQSAAVAEEPKVLHGNARAFVEAEVVEEKEVSTIDYLLDQKIRNESTPEIVLETANAVKEKETDLASSTEATRELAENPVEHVVHQLDKKHYRTNEEPDLSARTKAEIHLDSPRFTQSSWTLFETLENVEKTSPEPPDVKTTIAFYDTTIADPGESTIEPAPVPIGQRESPVKEQVEVNFRKEQMQKLQVKAKDQTEIVSKSGNISPQAPAAAEIQPATTPVDVAVTPIVDTPEVEPVKNQPEQQSGGMNQENQREKTTQDNRRPQVEAEPAPELPPVFQEKEPVAEPVTRATPEPVVETADVEVPDIEVDLPMFQPVTVEAKPAPEPVEIPEPTAPFLEESDTVSITEVANEEDYFPPLPGNASLQDGADVEDVTDYFPSLPGSSVDEPDPLAETITESTVAAAETAVEFEMPELPGSISREEAALQRVNAANSQIGWVEEAYTPDFQEAKPDLVEEYDPFASQNEEWFPEALTFQATGQTIETNEFGGADLTQFEEKYIPETVAPTPEEAYESYMLDANRVSDLKEKYIPEELFDIFS